MWDALLYVVATSTKKNKVSEGICCIQWTMIIMLLGNVLLWMWGLGCRGTEGEEKTLLQLSQKIHASLDHYLLRVCICSPFFPVSCFPPPPLYIPHQFSIQLWLSRRLFVNIFIPRNHLSTFQRRNPTRLKLIMMTTFSEHSKNCYVFQICFVIFFWLLASEFRLK